jgi:hypothetical protein
MFSMPRSNLHRPGIGFELLLENIPRRRDAGPATTVSLLVSVPRPRR